MSPGSDLPELKASLLRDLGVGLRSDQGDQAFERHQLLAIRFNRAARLNRRKSDQRDGTIWNRLPPNRPQQSPGVCLVWFNHAVYRRVSWFR